MDQLIPSLAVLLDAFAGCFRAEAFQTFRCVAAARALCPPPHTLSEVWQTAALAGRFHHDRLYSLFRSARWEWDDLGKLLLLMVLARLPPGGAVWLVVDDTLCHKRGANVAFGGFFLDAVTSSKKRKNVRFGVNRVVPGVALCLPFRPDRFVCLPVLWRAYRKKGTPGHRKKAELAAEMARLAADWLPERECRLAADSAYLNRALLKDRPPNLRAVGPVRRDAALFGPPPPGRQPGRPGRPRKRGDRLPAPRAMIGDAEAYPPSLRRVRVPGAERDLRAQVVGGVPWYHVTGPEPVTLVLVRDPSGEWRDEALVATGEGLAAEFVIAGYCRRWGIEVAFFESKQFLGLHDPQVWCEPSVERAHPMAWFVLSLTVLWYAESGRSVPGVKRDRPWYKHKRGPTFTDMLGALRLELLRGVIPGMSGDGDKPPEIPETLLHWLAAVR